MVRPVRLAGTKPSHDCWKVDIQIARGEWATVRVCVPEKTARYDAALIRKAIRFAIERDRRAR